MKSSYFVFFLIAVEFSFSFGQKDSSGNENPANASSESIPNGTQKVNSDSKTGEKNSHAQQPHYLITPDQKLIIEPRLYYPQFEDSVIPHLGFSNDGSRRQNILLSDTTGKYNLELQHLQQGTPANFQVALGAISAHIANQKNSPEYIPFPPNGDPYNYPAYRGHPRATEPPVVRAYERASNSNYDVQPADFGQQNSRRLYASDDYQPGFPNQFQNYGPGFYKNPGFFPDGAFYSDLRRNSYPIHGSRWYNQGEEFRRPIK